MVSMNMMDVIPIKSVVEDPKTLEKKRVVLVYDNLERVKMDPIELLGLINDFCENQGFNTILISESEEVLKHVMQEDSTTYFMLREKTVSQSLRYIPDFAAILSSILQERPWPSEEYAEYLVRHEDLILDVFASDCAKPVKTLLAAEDGKCHNLRSLTKGLKSFYRIYYHLQDEGIPVSDSHLYSFLAYYLAKKSGVHVGGQLMLDFDDNSLTRFYPHFSLNALTDSEREWILTGIWDKNAFLKELGTLPETGQADDAADGSSP